MGLLYKWRIWCTNYVQTTETCPISKFPFGEAAFPQLLKLSPGDYYSGGWYTNSGICHINVYKRCMSKWHRFEMPNRISEAPHNTPCDYCRRVHVHTMEYAVQMGKNGVQTNVTSFGIKFQSWGAFVSPVPHRFALSYKWTGVGIQMKAYTLQTCTNEYLVQSQNFIYGGHSLPQPLDWP